MTTHRFFFLLFALLILIMSLAGCSGRVLTGKHLEIAERLCINLGGIRTVYVDTYRMVDELYVSCNSSHRIEQTLETRKMT